MNIHNYNFRGVRERGSDFMICILLYTYIYTYTIAYNNDLINANSKIVTMWFDGRRTMRLHIDSHRNAIDITCG